MDDADRAEFTDLNDGFLRGKRYLISCAPPGTEPGELG
jgi:hypothetical protein